MQKEVNKRIAECMATLKKLDPYWLKGDGSVKQKLIVFDAVIRAKLMYGLESAQINDNLKRNSTYFNSRALEKY